MNVLIDCPQSRAGEWRFRLFGVPVAVKIWFWVATVLLCSAGETSTVLIWIGVCLASILVHELGHVYAYRRFGTDSEIVLYGWGGLTISRRDVRGAFPEVAVALAGPAAGFALVLLTLGLAAITGTSIRLGWHLFFPVLQAGSPAGSHVVSDYRWIAFLNDLLWVNLYWGLVNLLPIYPLDGWHAARALFDERDRGTGRRKALIWSAVAAAAMAVLGLAARSLYMVVIFAVLAASSAQAVEGERGRSTRFHGRWRG
jgi:membrane-associated protease RseP (regulator of RpoE activity)